MPKFYVVYEMSHPEEPDHPWYEETGSFDSPEHAKKHISSQYPEWNYTFHEVTLLDS